MKEISAKTILQKVKSNGDYWFKADYNMNLYKGCCHGCIYCDSRSSCYGVENFDEVRIKKDCLLILEKELYKYKRGVVGIGAMSDAYNPFEKQYRLTRGALKLIDKYNYGLQMSTKSDLILEDIDLIEKINKKSPVNVGLTITTYNDRLSKLIETSVSLSSERFEVLRQLSLRGIFCGVIFSPMLPFITDNEDNVRNMVRMASEAGASYIYTYYAVTLRDNQREYYYKKIESLKPGLSYLYRNKYKNSYVCVSPAAKKLKAVFESECDKYGLLYKMEDINEAYYIKRENKQISLF